MTDYLEQSDAAYQAALAAVLLPLVLLVLAILVVAGTVTVFIRVVTERR